MKEQTYIFFREKAICLMPLFYIVSKLFFLFLAFLAQFERQHKKTLFLKEHLQDIRAWQTSSIQIKRKKSLILFIDTSFLVL